jgi:hypothetical protein
MSRRTALIAALAMVTIVASMVVGWATPALADNCGTPSDCFGTAGSFGTASNGMLALVGLSLLLDFIPVVGTGKGLIEALTGRDLITGQELAWWERALGVVPVIGGVAAVGSVARGLDAATDLGRGADAATDRGRGADSAGDLASAGRRFETPDHPDLQGLPTKPTPTRTPADQYEIQHTGPDNYRFRDGGEQVWADGYRASDNAILDAKYVNKPASSPFIDGSNIPPKIRAKILTKIEDEFRRYSEVINDPATAPQRIEVITNSEAARPFFERLLAQYNIPGRVVVAP